MSNTPKHWNRVGYVNIIPENGTMWSSKNTNLDFSFDIKKPLAAVCSDAKIAIYGMNWENIMSYSTWIAEALALGNNTRIEVFAGYGENDDAAECIFSGTISYAMPSQPPGRILNIKARSGYFRFTKCINGDQAPSSGTPEDAPALTYDEWFKKVAGLLNGEIDISGYKGADIKRKISQPAFEGTATHDTIFKRMCDEAKNLNPEAFILEEDMKDGRYQFKLQNRYEDQEPTRDRAVVVSMENGLIGLPTINYQDIEVTTLLNTSIVRGGYIILDSDFTAMTRGFQYRDANDQKKTLEGYEFYRVYEVHYHGQLRGEKWYTTFRAWRFWKTGMLNPAEE